MRAPLSTPAGMRTVRLSVSTSEPEPWQAGQAAFAACPVPRQREQRRGIRAENETVPPRTASRNGIVMAAAASSSSPRPIPAPPPEKRSEKRSETSPDHRKPPPPGAAPPDGVLRKSRPKGPCAAGSAAGRPGGGLGRLARVSEAVVPFLLLRVLQDFVGTRDLLEALVRPGVADVHVRVGLPREAPVRLLDLRVARRARNTQDLVRILHRHSRENRGNRGLRSGTLFSRPLEWTKPRGFL